MEKLALFVIVMIAVSIISLVGLGFAIAKFGFIAIVYGLAIVGAVSLLGKIFN
ncbi:hypothetical protein ABE073_04520 [Lederbergia citrisecunda]|uniref:hypothetical protein n=1 Tax=Lederbergia citrisecunda TaxID=2833583 RepID=UPI003D29F718